VAPHAVYIDHLTRSASITLYNPGSTAIEVAISSFFGYPVTDSAGQFELYEPDSVDSSMPSASAWVEAYPKRMQVAPLQRQTVRILARPPRDLADGEYWARVVISAKEGAPPVTVADSAGIRVGLNLEIRSIIPLTYRKGPMQTGVRVGDLRVMTSGDSMRVSARLTRQGNAAYIGTAKGVLTDAAGKEVAAFEEPIAVYYEITPTFPLPRAGLQAGAYRLRFELSSTRPDIAPDLLLKAPPARDSVEVKLE
jgi:hypothetical protein